MSENSSLAERITALEKAAGAPGAGRRGPLRWLLIALLLILVAVNVWFLRQALLIRQQAGLERHFWIVGHASYPSHERTLSFLELVAGRNLEWRGAHLNKLNLEGVTLRDVDLQGVELDGSRLAKSSLAGARLTKAKLTLADFTEADLNGADLSGADFFKARLKGAQLQKAKLRGANLEQAEAAGANFLAADLADAYLLMADLSGANLVGATLSGANLEAAVLARASLSLARLDGVRLKDSDFTDSNWWRARGLTAEQRAQLEARFAPSEKSPQSLREDYRTWQESNGRPK